MRIYWKTEVIRHGIGYVQQYPVKSFPGTEDVYIFQCSLLFVPCVIKFWPRECEFYFQARAVEKLDFLFDLSPSVVGWMDWIQGRDPNISELSEPQHGQKPSPVDCGLWWPVI